MVNILAYGGHRSPPASDKESEETPLTSGSEDLSDWTTSEGDWTEAGSCSPLRPSTSGSSAQSARRRRRTDFPERASKSANRENECDEEPPRKIKEVSGCASPPNHGVRPSTQPFLGTSADSLNADSSALDFFLLFVSENLVQFVAQQTNNFYQFVVQLGLRSRSGLCNSKVETTTVEEMFCFLALCMLMPRSEKVCLSEYWSTDSLLSTPVFGEMMSQKRFILLLRMLHFSDDRNGQGRDKIGKIVDTIRHNFQQASLLFQALCINEKRFTFEGRLLLKQYVPPERSRCRAKLFVLCDSWTGYVLDFILYRKGSNNVENKGITDDVVGTFLQPFLEKGHTIYIENWVTSPALFTWLHATATEESSGKKHRKTHMFQMEDELKTGETVFHASNITMSLKWCVEMEMWMLSSYISAESATNRDRTTGKKENESQCIVEDNQNTGTVDCRDLIPSLIESIRTAIKWYKRYFFHLLDLSIFNGYALFKIATGKNVSMAQYHLSLIREITEKYCKGLKEDGGKK
ncbi:PiggyBac transposable element-derived protein 4 [Gryllus bimaculatus]|nr:PiggyBac transposable element-derived protein 4 [Gryllus bimaculatus]